MLDLALQLGPSSVALIREESQIHGFSSRFAAPRELGLQHTTWFHWIFAVEFDDLPRVRSWSRFYIFCVWRGASSIILRMSVKVSVRQKSDQFTVGSLSNVNVPQKQ